MKARPVLISLLLFGSGISVLIYQTVWLREFRLIFGSSSAASAAVLAIFFGGLGAGSIVLGWKVDKKPRRPVRFFALLQLFIAISAAASPFLLELVRTKYMSMGGTAQFGTFPATALRLALALVVLIVPTFLIGGTLPAASRVGETETDISRRKLALAFGANILGAFFGLLISTFYLLEHFGNRMTLWLACGLNLLVSLVAFVVFLSSRPVPVSPEKIPDDQSPRAPLTIVLLAAIIVGLVFLLMGLVSSRMMAPLLGASTFTCAILLAVALLGIGAGSFAYAFFGWENRPRLSTLALTCAAESFFIAVPFALGDRIAVLALLLRPLTAFGFCGNIFGWSQIAAIVVFPATFFAGLQFPMLIALLGKSRENIGWHTGLVSMAIAIGAIAGSFATCGLISFLSITGVWKLSVIVLATLAVIIWITSLLKDRRAFALTLSGLLTAAAILMLFALGPTAAWRQGPIGAGRGEQGNVTSANAKEEWLRGARRYVSYQADGVENCVGISSGTGLSLLINGKPAAHALYDASTYVTTGLLGAIMQPAAKRALVLGLGPGSTAGWLAEVPGMERVDVVELEPAMRKVAELCTPVNRNVLANPKVHIAIGDPREALLTTRESYDLIVSEPSDANGAGASGFYTRRYYDNATRRLRPGGLFLQQLPAYETDSSTIRSILATFAAAFPAVEVWQTDGTDLLFVGAMDPRRYAVDALRVRMTQEPFKTALTKIWRVTDVEGLLAHYIANDSFIRKFFTGGKNLLNTDDGNAVEFGLARTAGSFGGFEIPQLREAAHRQEADRPAITGTVDWSSVNDQNATIYTALGQMHPPVYSFLDSDQRRRVAAQTAYIDGNVTSALQLWRSQPRDAENLTEWAMMAELLGATGDGDALKYIEKVSTLNFGEASMLVALLRFSQGRSTEATEALEAAFESLRTDPWAMPVLVTHSFSIAQHIALQDAGEALAPRLYRALEKPFAVNVAEASRRKSLALIAAGIDRRGHSEYSHKAIAAFEPNVPWNREFLQARRDCYRTLSDPRAKKAEQDLSQFLANEPVPLETIQ